MNPSAARSLSSFGIYLLGLGALLILAPALVLAPVGIAVPQDVWIRVVGMVVGFLGVYYVVAARGAGVAFAQASVAVRASVIVFFAAFVAAGLAPAALLLFGVADLAGAAWTAVALRRGAVAAPAKVRGLAA